jgi:hypothetical protein
MRRHRGLDELHPAGAVRDGREVERERIRLAAGPPRDDRLGGVAVQVGKRLVKAFGMPEPDARGALGLGRKARTPAGSGPA